MKVLNRAVPVCVCVGLFALGDGLTGSLAQLPPPANTNDIQLSSWSFSRTNWQSDAGYPALALTNIAAVSAGLGMALLLDSTSPACLCYNVVETNGAVTNIALNVGSLAFWFSPDWSGASTGGPGPGDWASLIEVGPCPTNATSGYWWLGIDPLGQNICFGARTNSGPETVFLTAPIAWTNGTWHHIALAYSPSNSALYLDGALATNGLPVTVLPGPDVVAGGFRVGSATNGFEQMRGRLAGLTTWNYPLGADDVHSLWTFYSIFYGVISLSSAPLPQAPSQPGISTLGAWCAVTGQGLLTNSSSCGGASATRTSG